MASVISAKHSSLVFLNVVCGRRRNATGWTLHTHAECRARSATDDASTLVIADETGRSHFPEQIELHRQQNCGQVPDAARQRGDDVAVQIREDRLVVSAMGGAHKAAGRPGGILLRRRRGIAPAPSGIVHYVELPEIRGGRIAPAHCNSSA